MTDLSQFIGLHIDSVKHQLHSMGYKWREIPDETKVMLTCDLRVDRLNLYTKEGVVYKITVGQEYD